MLLKFPGQKMLPFWKSIKENFIKVSIISFGLETKTFNQLPSELKCAWKKILRNLKKSFFEKHSLMSNFLRKHITLIKMSKERIIGNIVSQTVIRSFEEEEINKLNLEFFQALLVRASEKSYLFSYISHPELIWLAFLILIQG